MCLTMVAVDAAGTPVRVSGAALAGGPLLVLSPGRRLQDVARVSAGREGTFPAAFRRAAAPLAAAAHANEALATVPESLPVRWGIPSFFGGAPYGPPYELENRTAEWALSAVARETYFPLDRQARMALAYASRAAGMSGGAGATSERHSVHPRGPSLTDGTSFFAALYNTTPTPPSLGVGVDATR